MYKCAVIGGSDDNGQQQQQQQLYLICLDLLQEYTARI